MKDFIMDMLGGFDKGLKKFTPAYFYEQRMKMGDDKYTKWLRKKYTYYSVMVYMDEEKRVPISRDVINVVNLIVEELNKMGHQTPKMIIKGYNSDCSQEEVEE